MPDSERPLTLLRALDQTIMPVPFTRENARLSDEFIKKAYDCLNLGGIYSKAEGPTGKTLETFKAAARNPRGLFWEITLLARTGQDPNSPSYYLSATETRTGRTRGGPFNSIAIDQKQNGETADFSVKVGKLGQGTSQYMSQDGWPPVLTGFINSEVDEEETLKLPKTLSQTGRNFSLIRKKGIVVPRLNYQMWVQEDNPE